VGHLVQEAASQRLILKLEEGRMFYFASLLEY
jgi:hypothetical protein